MHKDANDVLVQEGPEALKWCIRNPQPLPIEGPHRWTPLTGSLGHVTVTSCSGDIFFNNALWPTASQASHMLIHFGSRAMHEAFTCKQYAWQVTSKEQRDAEVCRVQKKIRRGTHQPATETATKAWLRYASDNELLQAFWYKFGHDKRFRSPSCNRFVVILVTNYHCMASPRRVSQPFWQYLQQLQASCATDNTTIWFYFTKWLNDLLSLPCN